MQKSCRFETTNYSCVVVGLLLIMVSKKSLTEYHWKRFNKYSSLRSYLDRLLIEDTLKEKEKSYVTTG
jgi:hypothetical protein